jgi:putative phosphoesterase
MSSLGYDGCALAIPDIVVQARPGQVVYTADNRLKALKERALHAESMKICIVSDSHDRGPMLATAIAEAKTRGASCVLHCGDLIGTNTLLASLKLDLPIHVIHGNNLGDPVSISRLACRSAGQLQYYGSDASLELCGRRIFMTHYPHIGEAFARAGDYDLVCCGHSHEPAINRLANAKGDETWLVNPGTVAGLGAPAATWVFGELEKMHFEIEALER